MNTNNLVTIYLYFLKNYSRSRSLAFMIGLMILVSSMATFFSIFMEDAFSSYLSYNGGIITQLPITLRISLFNYSWEYILVNILPIAAALFASPSIAMEYENRTIFQLFSLPVEKGLVLAGKLLSAFTVTFLVTSIFPAVQVIVSVAKFHSLPAEQFYISYILLALLTFSVVSFCFMISSTMVNSSYSIIAFLMIYFVGLNLLSAIFGAAAVVSPLLLLNNAGGIVDRVYVNINPTIFLSGGTLSPAGLSQIMYCSGVMFVYAVASLTVAYLVFTGNRANL